MTLEELGGDRLKREFKFVAGKQKFSFTILWKNVKITKFHFSHFSHSLSHFSLPQKGHPIIFSKLPLISLTWVFGFVCGFGNIVLAL